MTDYAASPTLLVVTDGWRSWVSSDGSVWVGGNTMVNGRSDANYMMEYGNGVFLAVSSRSYYSSTVLASSTDGVTWTDITPLHGTNVAVSGTMALSFANGYFFLITTTNPTPAYFFSANGAIWFTGTILGGPAPQYVQFGNFAFGNGRYMSLSGAYSATFLVGSSPSIMNYTQSTAFGPYANGYYPGGLAYGNGRFAIVSAGSTQCSTSTTGFLNASWALGYAPFGVARTFFLHDRFIVFGISDYTVSAVSADGVIWYPQLLPSGVVSLGGYARRVVYCAATGRFWVFRSDSNTVTSMRSG